SKMTAIVTLYLEADQTKSHKNKKKTRANFEEDLASRSKLVAALGELRAQIAALTGAGLDPATTARLQAAFYRAASDFAPNYHQDNEDWAVDEAITRTCNVTSLSMALESLGKTAIAYRGDWAKVNAAGAAVGACPDAGVASSTPHPQLLGL